MLNPFFKNFGPFKIDELLKATDVPNKENFTKDKIYNVSDLMSATDRDLTFFHSKKFFRRGRPGASFFWFLSLNIWFLCFFY